MYVLRRDHSYPTGAENAAAAAALSSEIPALGIVRGGSFQSLELVAGQSLETERRFVRVIEHNRPGAESRLWRAARHKSALQFAVGCGGGGGHIGCMADAEMKPLERKRTMWRVVMISAVFVLVAYVVHATRSNGSGPSRNVRELVASSMGKEVSALTTEDYARFTALSLHRSQSPMLTLPSPLARWQYLIPDRNRIITDDDLKGLDQLPALQGLDLDGTQVTDAGLVHLTKLPTLQELGLRGTKVTEAGVERFKEERRKAGLPECEVVR